LPIHDLLATETCDRTSGLANGGAGHCKERWINESWIEQTVVAFDVTLKTPTSRQGTGGLLPTLKAGAPLGSQGVRRDPACEWPRCGVFL